MGDKELVYNQDYSVVDDVLRIPNVTDDIVVNAIKPVTNGMILFTTPYSKTSNNFDQFKVYNKIPIFSISISDINFIHLIKSLYT